MRERTIERWKFLAWQALSRKKRSIGYCQKCGKKNVKLEAHHLITKAHGNYAKFEEDNIVALCYYCHRIFFHGNSTWDEERDFIEKLIGLDRYWEMKRKSSETVKYTAEDYAGMIEGWTDEIS